MKLKKYFLIIGLSIFIGGCQKDPILDSIDQKIERVAKKYIIHGRTPGVIVGTIKNGETKIYSYGVADLKTGALIDEYTIFEIGSITKTFTGLLAAEFVLEGRFTLQDTVNKFLPTSLQLPSKNNNPIRWVHILNHTSGLDREPDDLDANEPFNYSESQMAAYLNRVNLLTTPGQQVLYSNSGMGLAGYSISKMTDSTYASLIDARIFSKLNMTYSFCNNQEKPLTNTAQGYYGNKPVDYFIMSDVFAGAGVIKSNMHDMLIYLDNLINPEVSVLKDAINLSLTSTVQIDESVNIGLGWFLGKTGNQQDIVFHDGGTKGFSSFIIFNKDKKTGVVVLVNSFCISEQVLIGQEIMQILNE